MNREKNGTKILNLKEKQFPSINNMFFYNILKKFMERYCNYKNTMIKCVADLRDFPFGRLFFC